jgi:hypothetical protein
MEATSEQTLDATVQLAKAQPAHSLRFRCQLRRRAARMKSLGYNTAIRYYDHTVHDQHPSSKLLSVHEAAQVLAAGFDLVVVYESTNNMKFMSGEADGRQHGKRAGWYATNKNPSAHGQRDLLRGGYRYRRPRHQDEDTALFPRRGRRAEGELPRRHSLSHWRLRLGRDLRGGAGCGARAICLARQCDGLGGLQDV